MNSASGLSGRYFVFGDLHGHYRELMALYHVLIDRGLIPEIDTLVFLGDHVDSGPDSRRVVSQLMAWQAVYPHWIFLFGNHEQLLLDARTASLEENWGMVDRWWSQGGAATWRSYLTADKVPLVADVINPFDTINPNHLDWLEALPLFHETERYVFVHAGLRPGKSAGETDPQELIWIRDEFIRSDWDWGKRVIYGHTPVVEPLVLPNKIGLDTLPRNVGKLTVVELDDHSDAVPRFTFQAAF